MSEIKPWLAQLARSFVRKNNMKPTALDVPEIRWNKMINGGVDRDKGTKGMSGTFLYTGKEGAYRGSSLIEYETVHLETLFKNNEVPVVYIYNPHSTREIAEQFVAQYGLSLDSAWFADEPFDGSTVPTHVTLRVIENNFCAPSILTIRLEQPQSDIEKLFVNDVLDQPSLPFDPLMRSSAMTTYGKDFSVFYDDQRIWFSGTPVQAGYYRGYESSVTNPSLGRLELVKHLENVIDTDAVISLDTSGNTPNLLNLAYFYVRYNGKTAGAMFGNISADTAFDNVMIIEPYFGPDKTNYSGALFIHYNNA